MQTATVSTTPLNGKVSTSDLTLDALAERSYDELAALYGKAKNAKTMHAVDGTPKGRMLAVRGIDATPLGILVRAFAASSAFLWDGKTFGATSDTEGRGINRIQIAGALGRQNLFPFETLFGASEIDGQPALILNYDLPENPPWIRRIHDEVREIAPGLFFGPAMWKKTRKETRGKPLTLLWFALDTRSSR
jgi:hypothetical protein